MQRIEYSNVYDKTNWGAGDWQKEPDKVQWQDEETGLPCLIVRGPTGALCGYVGVPQGHPAYGLSYDGELYEHQKARMDKFLQNSGSGIPYDKWEYLETKIVPGIGEEVAKIEVHGGLTYADGCDHGDENSGICYKPDPEEPDTVWWFGFDCGHNLDLCPKMRYDLEDLGLPQREFPVEYQDTYKNIAYVEAEVRSLAKQLNGMTKLLTFGS